MAIIASFERKKNSAHLSANLTNTNRGKSMVVKHFNQITKDTSLIDNNQYTFTKDKSVTDMTDAILYETNQKGMSLSGCASFIKAI